MTTSYDPFSLQGKTILVTGASSGIGKATAIECSKMGASVIITGRNKVRLDETFDQLYENQNKKILCDLSSDEGIKNLIDSIPKLDGIVLAAGIVEMLPATFATKDKITKIYSTNLFSPIEILRSVIRKKLYNKPFSAVGISSISSNVVTPANGIYGSGKAALTSFFRYFAYEMAAKGVRINTISPGMIHTPMHTEGVVEKERLEEEVDRIPMKRWGLPIEIAQAAVFLLSNASSYITGTDIWIDGGASL